MLICSCCCRSQNKIRSWKGTCTFLATTDLWQKIFVDAAADNTCLIFKLNFKSLALANITYFNHVVIASKLCQPCCVGNTFLLVATKSNLQSFPF